jgi:homoserine dehydrogenase
MLIHATQGKGATIADCTSSDGVAAQYPEWMDKGISIVTPNKKGFSGDRALFDTIIGKRAGGKAYAYHEATVGAGLVCGMAGAPALSALDEHDTKADGRILLCVPWQLLVSTNDACVARN